MAQRQRTLSKSKSDFPIFEYLDRITPGRLIANFLELPRHYRWLIVSILASAFLLWVFLRVVVGGLNTYVESRKPQGVDTLRLSYGLETRPLPQLPETLDPEAQFVVLPPAIAEYYVLQIPPSAEEAEARAEAELEAFLALSVPVEDGLLTLQETLAEQVVAQAEAAAAPTQAAAPAEVSAAAIEVLPTAIVMDATAVPTAAPTVDPIQAQSTAVNNALLELQAINLAVEEAESIAAVYPKVAALQSSIGALTSAGVTLPELDAFNAHLTALAAVEPPTVYQINDCLRSSKMIVRRQDTAAAPPCVIDQTATYVESGNYLFDGQEFNVVAAQYPHHAAATTAAKQVFYHTRSVGRTGNFALGPIEYDYVFSFADGVYSLTWTHENWAYSLSTKDNKALEQFVKFFPY